MKYILLKSATNMFPSHSSSSPLSLCLSLSNSVLRFGLLWFSNALNCRINLVGTQQILHATHVSFRFIVFEPGVNFNHYIAFTRTSKFMEIEHTVTLIKSTEKWNICKKKKSARTKIRANERNRRARQRWNLRSFFFVNYIIMITMPSCQFQWILKLIAYLRSL